MRSPARAATFAWTLLLVIAGALALRAAAMWLGALASGAPVLYGEGAVAHASQILARGGDPYAMERPGTFVAANYPPLAFAVGALVGGLGPFAGARAVAILATAALAATVARRAGSGLVGAALALAFIALFPVQIWGPAAKPDPLAVAFTALAVVTAGASWRRAGAAGVLGALAILAKPTALLPLVAVGGYLVLREPATARRTLAAGAVTLAVSAALLVARSGLDGPIEHIVRRNLLAFSGDSLVGLGLVGALSLGVPVAVATRVRDGRLLAYLAGAAAVVVLGGREGATINYLLDLAAASLIAVASRARADRPYLPIALAAQLVLAIALFRPFEPTATTGAWGDPGRVTLAADLSRDAPHLVEDSGLLIANRVEPEVDDLFLWARLVAHGTIADEVTPRVRAAEFAAVVSEVDLAALDRAPAYERQRWIEPLRAAVLEAYGLDRSAQGHFRYLPRRPR
jgi:hypothetical protein